MMRLIFLSVLVSLFDEITFSGADPSGSAVRKLSNTQIQDITETFHEEDANKDGYLTMEEYFKFLKKETKNASFEEMKTEWERKSPNGAPISLVEYIRIYEHLDESDYNYAFGVLDENKDGGVDISEFVKVLKLNLPTKFDADEKIEQLFKTHDKDDNGELDKTEFEASTKELF